VLRIQLLYVDGSSKYAEYYNFAVGSEDDKFKLSRVGTYAGNTGASASRIRIPRPQIVGNSMPRFRPRLGGQPPRFVTGSQLSWGEAKSPAMEGVSTTILVPAYSDVSVAEEVVHIKHWADANKMVTK